MAKKATKYLNMKEYTKDVTINDFANSSAPKTGRVKKNEINNIIPQVKSLSIVKNEQSWDEKLNYLDKNRNKNMNGSKRTLKNKKKWVERKSNKGNKKITYKVNRKYPIELWFKISEYIAPEDVGRFASICWDTRTVVSTGIFWYKLYKRYYKEVPDLPELLQPKCIVRKYGLRANVIRALYIMYPPFVNRLKSEISFQGDHKSLVKRICILSWSQEKKNQWVFYFKLKNPQEVNCARDSDEKKPGLLEMLEDINANVDHGCKVLEVTSKNYVPLPMISGQRLNGVSLNRYNKLELNFGCGTSPHMGSSDVTLNSVSKIRVLDWWHPSFPHSNGLNCTSYSNESNYLMDEIDSYM